jgi:hypothetical protein
VARNAVFCWAMKAASSGVIFSGKPSAMRRLFSFAEPRSAWAFFATGMKTRLAMFMD